MKKLSSKQRKKQIRAIAAIPENQIDTSDIPELTDDQISRSVRGQFHQPLKQQITLRLDADVIQGLKNSGPGYQTKVNRLLRDEMLRSTKRKAKRKGTLADFLLASPLRGSGIKINSMRMRLKKADL